MPQVASVVRLPSDVKAELDRRLKESGYGDLIKHAAWLKSQGCPISKSALHRYSVGEKARNRVATSIGRMLKNEITGLSEHEQFVDLLLELGVLRVREARILSRIEQLSGVHSIPPEGGMS